MNLNDEYVYFHEFALQPVSPTPPPLPPIATVMHLFLYILLPVISKFYILNGYYLNDKTCTKCKIERVISKCALMISE